MTATHPTTTPKAGRTARLLFATADQWTLNVTDAGVTDRVTITRLAGAFLYLVEWFGHPAHKVYLSPADTLNDACCCKGHLYRNQCRHLSLLRALKAAGILG